MKKSKSIILISLIPVLITLVFIMYVFLPAFSSMQKLETKVENKQDEIESAKLEISKAKAHKKLMTEIIELENILGDFHLSVPEKHELALFLIDMDRFAQKSGVKIVEIIKKNEGSVTVKDPNAVASKSKKQSKRRRRKAQEPELPIKLYEIPLDIQVLGYYTDVLKFMDYLESYQRKVIIDGVFAKDFEKDDKTLNPRIRTTLYAKVYRLIEQDVVEVVDDSKNSNKFRKTKAKDKH